MPSSPNNPTRHAFTLIEVMVVVLIVAVLSTMALPYFGQAYRDAALRTAGDDLHAAARYLQRTAVLKGTPHRLVLIADDPESGRSLYKAERATADLDAESSWEPLKTGPIKPTTLDQTIHIDDILLAEPGLDPTPSVTFYPDGSADAAVIYLTQLDRTVSILIYPTDGRAEQHPTRIPALPNLREDLDE